MEPSDLSNGNMFECVSPKAVPGKSALARVSSLPGAHLSGSVRTELTQPTMPCLTLFPAGATASDNERFDGNNSAALLSHSASYYLNSARASDFTIFPKLAEQQTLDHAKQLPFDSCSLSSLYPVLSDNSSRQVAVSLHLFTGLSFHCNAHLTKLFSLVPVLCFVRQELSTDLD